MSHVLVPAGDENPPHHREAQHGSSAKATSNSRTILPSTLPSKLRIWPPFNRYGFIFKGVVLEMNSSLVEQMNRSMYRIS